MSRAGQRASRLSVRPDNTPLHRWGGAKLGAHRSGLANAEVGGSSPPRPTIALSSIRPDNTANGAGMLVPRRHPGAKPDNTPVRPDNAAGGQPSESRGVELPMRRVGGESRRL